MAKTLSHQPWHRVIKRAPGELVIAQALINSEDRVLGSDELTSPRALADWLVRWRLAHEPPEIDQADLDRALEVRRALRDLVRAHGSGQDAPGAALAVLDREAARAPLRVRFEAGGHTRLAATAGGLDGFFSRLFAALHEARSQKRWRRINLCTDESCRRAFYHASPPRSAKWCSMGLCGARLKAKTYRRRVKRRKEAYRHVRWVRPQQQSAAQPPAVRTGPPEADPGADRHQQKRQTGDAKGHRHQKA